MECPEAEDDNGLSKGRSSVESPPAVRGRRLGDGACRKISLCGGNKDDDTLGGQILILLLGVGGVSVEVVGMEAVM